MKKESKEQTNKKKRIIMLITVIALIGIIVGSIVIKNVVVNQEAEGENYLAGGNASSSLMASYIRKGITIGGITGTLESLDTSDATAKAEDILEGKTAYVNGVKITGTMKTGPGLGDITGEEKENTETQDSLGNKVVIPAGFKVVNPQDNVENGIIIEDVSAGNTNTKGSQFVWVPVGKIQTTNGEKEIILGRYTFSTSTPGTPTLQQAAYTDENPENYKNSKVIETYYDEYSGAHRDGVASSGLDGLNATANDLGAWIESVKENGGYYIGRYEASYASGSSVDNYKAATKVSEHNSTSSMSYNPGTLWNYITQLEASKVAINTYKESTSVKSDLMNSYAWDTAIVYIQECGNTNYANQTSKNSSLANTGTGQDEVCKINDMSSNISEWTTEYSSFAYSSSARPCTDRGGGYDNSGVYTAGRSSNLATGSYDSVGFRISLYM